ncbi:MAG TPA: alpha/beta fold hydrolase [Acidimicrobiales bacterium]|jgi:2-succinyl-6-hydroxy-2,4-cyclohexadiene-1-carboxylate synthase
MPSLPARRIGDGPRLALVHGFTQTGGSWDPVATILAADHEVVTVDAPGHGAASAIETGLVQGAELLAEAAGAATYVGYSMGGRYCLHTALYAPDAVLGLVLVSATGGIDDADERAARRAADERLADRIGEIGVAAFVDEWLAQPLFATLDAAAADRDGRLVNTAQGLASSLRLAGTGTQLALWDDLADIDVPVLVLAGELDAKFRAAGERLAAAIGPNATYAVVPGAGHTAHLEQPDAFLAILRPWLATHGL